MKFNDLFVLLLCIIFSYSAFSQSRESINGFLGGIESGISTSNFREEVSPLNAYGRVFVQSPGRILELGVGYFKFRDHTEGIRSYETDIYNIDLKFGGGTQGGPGSFQLYPLGVSLAYVEKLKSPFLFPSKTNYEVGKKYDWIVSYVASMNYDIHLSKFMSIGFTLGLNLANGFVLKSEDSTTRTNIFYFGTRIVFGSNGFTRDSDDDGIQNSDEEDIYKTNPENQDTDGDGLSDYDEIFKYKTDPLKADTDGDGFLDGQEVNKYGTKPLESDTDGDGISDGEEILTYKTDPRKEDTDGDGLSDYDEIFVHKSDPLKADTDGDGISDQVEVVVYKTSPILADTDGDGISDHDEVMDYKTSPFKSDTDGDGINDFQEITVYITDPFKADTDGDSLNDYDEITVYKTNPLKNDTDIDRIYDGIEVYTYKTNPLSEDSDRDGLGDYQEIFEYSTNPLSRDTDSSGVDDKTEIERGTDPVDIEDDVIEVDKVIVLEGIEFEFKKADITPESERRLQKTLKLLYAFPDYTFSLEGHTDDIGSKQFNKKLSFDRANAVKKWLVDRGINPKRLTVKGFGFDRPIATNDTEEGRQRNRRVEFIRTN